MNTLSSSQKKAINTKIKKLVLKYHINVGGIDYDAWARRVDDRTADLSGADVETFETGIRELLAELRTSHTTFFREVPERLLPEHTISATLRKVQVAGRDHWMFVDVFEEGAADRAGIKPGHLLYSIDNEAVTTDALPMFNVSQRYYFTIGRAGAEQRRDVEVTVPAVKGSKAQPPFVAPKTIAHRMLESGVGVLKIGWFTASMGLGFAKELDAALAELKNRGCGRLIVDLRGNIGGGLGFARLASYMCPGKIPIGQSLTPKRLRSGYNREALPRIPMPNTKTGLLLALTRFLVKDKSLVLLTQGLGPQPFHGKIAVLVNEFTHSAAEMVANFAAENGVAVVVGTKTNGTVLGARNLDVGGGYWLRLPVFGWFTSRGESIEGVGVVPNVPVDPLPDLVESGDDKQLVAAMDLTRGMPGAHVSQAQPI